MRKVLDAFALMAYFEKEDGHKEVEDCLIEAARKDQPVLMTTVNYGEVYYSILRAYGLKKVQDIDAMIKTLPIEMVPADELLARESAAIKAFHKMSYADCFAAALAQKHKAEILTGDKEFKSVERDIKIHWIV